MDEKTQRAIKKYPHRAVDIAQSYDKKQIACKQWLYDELKKLSLPSPHRIFIAGGWFGNILIPQLLDIYPHVSRIKLHDLDEEAIKICRNIYFQDSDIVRADIQDSTDFIYDSFVINTSCEHMDPLMIRPQSYVVLQSNNYREIEDHINCVDSCDELADQYGLVETYYAGKLDFEKYTRYMVIGKV